MKYWKVNIFLLLFFLLLTIPFKVGAVTVGPVKLEYSLNPGDVVNGEIYLKNEETDGKNFYPTFERFTEQNGEKVFIKDENLLKDWFKFPASVSLKGGEDQKVSYTLTIPQDAPPGGQFGVLWWGTTPPNTTGTEQVSIQTRAGILVYINISGDVVSTAEITRFLPASGKSMSFGGTIPLALTISNTGNVYIKPEGKVRISSIFGSTKAEIPVNPKGYQILPKSYRDLGDMEWAPGIFAVGPYKAVATVSFGETGQTMTATKWIWVLPLKLIGIVLLVIILIVLFFKWYNRLLLKRYQGKS